MVRSIHLEQQLIMLQNALSIDKQCISLVIIVSTSEPLCSHKNTMSQESDLTMLTHFTLPLRGMLNFSLLDVETKMDASIIGNL